VTEEAKPMAIRPGLIGHRTTCPDRNEDRDNQVDGQ
jgi:hypothetical protein